MEPVRCTLTTKQAHARLLEWSDLRSLATEVTTLPQGVRFVMPLASEAAVRDLAARECDCCSFLTITVDRDEDTVVMSITAPTEDGRSVIAAFAPVD